MKLSFGAMSDKLEKQCRDAGVAFDRRKIALCQKFADAVTLLAVHSILTEAEARRVRKRIVKEIAKAIRE